jgi:hypothetical protein
MVGTVQVWPDAAPPEVPQYLYDVEIEYLADYEVRFTLLKGFMPNDPTDESFLFRATPEQAGINGYVTRTFTKKWASQTVRTCTMIDQYGDGTPNPDLLQKEVTIQVAPRKTVAADTRQAGAIKGNADSGLYHMPDSAHYDETIAEQWFATEADAKAAGFVKYTGKRRKKT